MNSIYRDVLNEGTPAEFEQAVFRQTLRAARRARRTRAASRVAATAVILVSTALLFFSTQEKSNRTVENNLASATASNVEAASTLRSFRSAPFPHKVRTELLPSPARLSTTSGLVAVVRTSDFDQLDMPRISDDQLLAFFHGKAVALVGRGPGRAELVFPENERSE